MSEKEKVNKTLSDEYNSCGYIPRYENGDFTGYEPSPNHKNCIEGYECCSPIHSPPPPNDDGRLASEPFENVVFSPCTETFGFNWDRKNSKDLGSKLDIKPVPNALRVRVPVINKIDEDRYCLSNKWAADGIRIIDGLGWGSLKLGGWIIFAARLPMFVPKPMAVPDLLGKIKYDRDDVLASVQISAYDPEHAYWLSTSNVFRNGMVTGTLLFDDWIVNVHRPVLEAETSCCQ